MPAPRRSEIQGAAPFKGTWTGGSYSGAWGQQYSGADDKVN